MAKANTNSLNINTITPNTYCQKLLMIPKIMEYNSTTQETIHHTQNNEFLKFITHEKQTRINTTELLKMC